MELLKDKVQEICPGLFRSAVYIEAESREIDMGCYPEKSQAAVAHDVMVLKLRYRSDDQRRLPRVPEELLVNSIKKYERISRELFKELAKSTEQLAVDLKANGVAAALANLLSAKTAPPPPPHSKPFIIPKAPSGVAGSSNATKFPAQTAPVAVAAAPAAAPTTKPTAAGPAAPQKKVVAAPSSAIPSTAGTKRAAVVDDDEKIKHVWLKRAEYPPGSGKFPCFIKRGQLQNNYITLVLGVCEALFTKAVHGDFTAEHVDDPSRTWTVQYSVKEVPLRQEVGNFKGQRYLRSMKPVYADLGLDAGDVVFLKIGDGKTKIKVGGWKKDSPEGQAFLQELWMQEGLGPIAAKKQRVTGR